MLTTKTRRRIEKILDRLGKGRTVELEEIIQVNKYALHIPFIAKKLKKAQEKRIYLEKNGLI